MTDSEKIMSEVDRMKPAMRALVHAYGFVIVRNMIAEGHTDAKALRPILETWRQRRQSEWLNSLPFQKQQSPIHP
jgi:hypothetical protein